MRAGIYPESGLGAEGGGGSHMLAKGVVARGRVREVNENLGRTAGYVYRRGARRAEKAQQAWDEHALVGQRKAQFLGGAIRQRYE